MNETVPEIMTNIIFGNIDKSIILILFLILIFVGLKLAQNSTINLLKTIFNKFIIGTTIIFSIYCILILYILSYSPFFSVFRFSDVMGLLFFDFLLLIFESYELAYNNEYAFKTLNKLLKSFIWVFVLNIISNPQKIEMYYVLYNIVSDMALVIIMESIIFPIMYLIALGNEYYQIHSFIKSYNLNFNLKSVFLECKLNLKKVFEYKKKIEKIQNNETDSINENLFELENNTVYKLGKEVGKYSYCKNLPNSQNMSNCKTKHNKYEYVVNFEEGKDDNINYLYVPLDDLIIKLCLKTETIPLDYQSDLVEFIHEKKNDLIN